MRFSPLVTRFKGLGELGRHAQVAIIHRGIPIKADTAFQRHCKILQLNGIKRHSPLVTTSAPQTSPLDTHLQPHL